MGQASIRDCVQFIENEMHGLAVGTVCLGLFGSADEPGPDGESLTGWNLRSQVRPLSVSIAA